MKYLSHYPKDLQDKIQALVDKKNYQTILKINIQLPITIQMTKPYTLMLWILKMNILKNIKYQKLCMMERLM